MKPAQELGGVEILRFVCALSVLIWHYQHFFFIGAWDPATSVAIRPSLPLYREFSFFYENGSLAVQFFWAISGFIFYWHYADAIRERVVGFREFAVRRFSRLYPLHLLTLLLVACGQYVYYRLHGTTYIYLGNKPIWFATQLLFASNWLARQPESFNGPIWSVSIEILIYLTFFAVARITRFQALLAAGLSLAFALCFAYANTFINPLVFECGMYFFAGGLAQRASRRHGAFVLACVLAGVAMFMITKTDSSRLGLLLLAATSVVIFARLGEGILRAPFRRLAFLGNATYSSYLLHFPLQLLTVIVVDRMGWSRSFFWSPVAFLGYLIVVVGLSLVVYREFEVAAQKRLRDLWRGSCPVAVA